MSVPACLLPKWSVKDLRLVGVVSPHKTEVEGRFTGPDRQPLKALEALGTAV
ncbi:TPA: hypothetical protein ACH3X1_006656 [Trebouxia sp. C0004]